MRFPSAMLCLVALAAPAAAQTDVTSAIDSVTVYPDGATVTRVISRAAAGDNTLRRAISRPASIQPRCGSKAKARAAHHRRDRGAPAARRTAAASIPNLKTASKRLNDQRGRARRQDRGRDRAAEIRRTLCRTVARPVSAKRARRGRSSDWRAAFAAVAEEIASADAAIRAAQTASSGRSIAIWRGSKRSAAPIRRARWKCASISLPTQRRRRRCGSPTRCAARAGRRSTMRGSTPARRDRKPSLELVRRAEIVQNTGEDWSDVALAVSTVRTAKGGSAPDLRPLIVRYPQPGARRRCGRARAVRQPLARHAPASGWTRR